MVIRNLDELGILKTLVVTNRLTGWTVGLSRPVHPSPYPSVGVEVGVESRISRIKSAKM